MVANSLTSSNQDVAADDAVPRNEYTDLYNEIGPDNVGGMGGEPACTITLFSPSHEAPHHDSTEASARTHTASPKAASSEASQDKSKFQSETAASGGNNTDVEVQTNSVAGDGQSSRNSPPQPAYRAVEQIDCEPHRVVAIRSGQQQQMLLGLSNDVDCAVVAFRSSGQALVSEHMHTIPALAYVAAGEAQTDTFTAVIAELCCRFWFASVSMTSTIDH